ncbi:hypothetical protein E5S69_31580 [Cupriavidus necator]|uniref:hypothetical protein n=1 Tax=Cupriavidus necator TaxID=106590 RepID=UPI00148FA978|nr:hypothetical protein [Cupriavidus necator]NOV28029.1 hypothetical protein [Cupriavidus necator]
MSKQREGFEAWLVGSKRGYRDEKHGVCSYDPGALHRYWEAWQASRAAALEEAAGICDERSMFFSGSDDAAMFNAEACADAIRALKEQS